MPPDHPCRNIYSFRRHLIADFRLWISGAHGIQSGPPKAVERRGLPYRAYIGRGSRSRTVYRQQRPAHAVLDDQRMLDKGCASQLDVSILRQLRRRAPVCVCHGLPRRTDRSRTLPHLHNQYRRSKGVHAVDHSVHQRHRGHRVSSGRVLGSGNGLCGLRLRALDSKYVLHPLRHTRRSRCRRLANGLEQSDSGHSGQHCRRSIVRRLHPHLSSFKEVT